MKNLASQRRESANLNFIAYKDALTYAGARMQQWAEVDLSA